MIDRKSLLLMILMLPARPDIVINNEWTLVYTPIVVLSVSGMQIGLFNGIYL